MGAAIEDCGGPDSAQSVYEKGRGGLQKVYDLLSEDVNWNDSCWTLWAPDVVPAAGGGWWLWETRGFGPSCFYFSWCR